MIRNTGPGLWGGQPTWRITEVARIGSIDDATVGFGNVAAVDLDSAGRAYVLDSFAKEVRVFDQRGIEVRRFGRSGRGPGELANPTGLKIQPSGAIWVADFAAGRYSVFDTAGAYLGAYPTVGQMASPWPGSFDRAGRLYDWNYRRRDAQAFEPVLIAYEPHGDGKLVPKDTLPLPVPVDDGIQLPGGSSARRPFAADWKWYLDARGHLWVGRSDAYRIAEVSPEGDTIRIIERAVEPERLSRQHADAARERMMTHLERLGLPLPPHIDLPDYRPFFEAFMVDDAGYLWVNRTNIQDELRAPGSPVRYDVFNPEGMYLGELTAPVGLFEYRPTPVIRRGEMLGVVTDSLGVQYVVRARIERDPSENL